MQMLYIWGTFGKTGIGIKQLVQAAYVYNIILSKIAINFKSITLEGSVCLINQSHFT